MGSPRRPDLELVNPNRTGIGPLPNDWPLPIMRTRTLELVYLTLGPRSCRVAYHANEHWAMGVGIEDANQFIGNYIALPAAFGSVIGPQFDNNSQPGAANRFPDILSKITYDRDFSGRHFHAELSGLFTGAHAAVKPIGASSFTSHGAVGWWRADRRKLRITRTLTLLGNGFWSDGGAHYLVGTGPQLVVQPNAAGTNVSLSMLHAGAGSAGLEWRASPKVAFAVYYSADYFSRDFFADTTNTAHPGTIIGYGGPGSPNTNNRAIQQITFDWLQTFWKSQDTEPCRLTRSIPT